MRQPPRSDGHTGVIRRVCAQHLKHVVAQRALNALVRIQLDVAVPPQGLPRRGIFFPWVRCVRVGRFCVQQHAHALFHRDPLARTQAGVHLLRPVTEDAQLTSRMHRAHHQLPTALAHGFQQAHRLRFLHHLIVMDGQVAHLRIHDALHPDLRILKGRERQAHAQKLPVRHAGHALRLHGHGPPTPTLDEYPRAQVQFLRNLCGFLPHHAQPQRVGQLHHIRHAGTNGLEEPRAEHGMIVRATLGRLQAEAPHAQTTVAHREKRLRILAHRAVQRNVPRLDAHISHRSSPFRIRECVPADIGHSTPGRPPAFRR